jgi:hypothetical protein
MKLIPIQSQALEDPGCDEESGIVPKLNIALARREFLKGSGVLFGTIASSSILAGLAPSQAWALELKSLSDQEGLALMAMGRTLFPHEKLPDAVYALLAKDLDAAVSGDATTAKLIKEGIATLNSAAGGSFSAATAEKRLMIVGHLQGTAFFNKVRGQCITSLYDNDMAFAFFGYPGSAWEKGGYITRGFQDLKWLPDPPADASPAPYL